MNLATFNTQDTSSWSRVFCHPVTTHLQGHRCGAPHYIVESICNIDNVEVSSAPHPAVPTWLVTTCNATLCDSVIVLEAARCCRDRAWRAFQLGLAGQDRAYTLAMTDTHA
ncbi:hypothetical protein PINS_up020909 [Pythium insidiosum]|nr:hypothetical protein PINS_up000291 [Pythium insidiosum]GLE09300.1 hypothetical protein PINS_up020909 [Pythium insidiosum]